MTTIVNLGEFEALARARLSPAAYADYAGGSQDELTRREDEAAFARRRLLPRVLVDGSAVDPSTTLLGQPVAIPIGFAPAAGQGLANTDGEVTSARVAARAGVLYCLSTPSDRSLEDVAAVGPGPRWLQLSVQAERGRSEEIVRRAVAAGYRALILTVDSASAGERERDPVLDGSLRWDDLAWLGGLSALPLVVRGIIDPADAVLAVEHGAAAVWVSNHGARQLDRSPAGVDALEGVVDAVAGRAEVYLEGGVRRGTDVVTALALGARAVFIGRPHLYALAAEGEAGVVRCIEILETELRIAMTLLGAPTLAAITPDRVVR